MKKAALAVVPCASEAEAMLKKASKKGMLHYLPGDNSFDVKPNVALNDAQKKALDVVKALIEKYGSTGVQEGINIGCFKLLNLVAV